MGGKSSRQVVGYWYYLGLHFAICYGPVDSFRRILAGEREAWSGFITSNSTIRISAASIFGGKKKEGGIEGDADVMMGGPDQTANAYLSEHIDGLMPAFRGILSLVYNGGKISANNPYVKPWAFEVQRILTGWNGETWYPETAEVYLEEFDADGFAGETVAGFPVAAQNLYQRADSESIDYWGATSGSDMSSISRRRYDAAGNLISTTALSYSIDYEPLFLSTVAWFLMEGPVRNLPDAAFGFVREQTPAAITYGVWFYGGVASPKRPVRYKDGTLLGYGGDGGVQMEVMVYYEGYIYAYTGGANVGEPILLRFLATGGFPSEQADEQYDLPSSANWKSQDIFVNNEGVWWALNDSEDEVAQVIHLSHDLGTIHKTYTVPFIGHYGILVCSGRIVMGASETYPNPWRVQQLNSDGTTTTIGSGVVSPFQGNSFKPVVVGSSLLVNIQHINCNAAPWAAMNPAHIIYQCLTDPNWGMGYPVAQIDDDSFSEAADVFFAEGLGLCLIWNQSSEIEDFIQIVLDHAGAVYFADPKTGKFKLKALRADYDVEYLEVYDESNIIRLDNFQRPGYGETVNEITVVYRDHYTYKDSSITVQDLANIQIQGAVVSQTRQYPGLPISTLAARTAERDLMAASTPLARCRITVNRSAWEETPGNVIKVNWDKLGLTAVVFRVLAINYGNLTNGELVVELAEDVYGLPNSSYSIQEPTEFVPPDITPTQVTVQDVVETPYWDIARAISAADLSFLDPDSGFVMAVASASNSASLGFEMYTRVLPAVYVSADASGTFAPTAVIAGSAGLTKQDTVIEYGSPVNIDDVSVGQRVMIGTGRSAEFAEITDIDTDAAEITVNRGILDTTPQEHAVGSRLWFNEDDFAVDPTERATGDSVDVKLSVYSGGGETDIAGATAMNLVPDQRLYRPYPPGKVRINDEEWPTEIVGPVMVTWAHRDRLQQLVNYVDQNENSIGPEAGTTYTIRYYLDSDLLDTESGITGTAGTSFIYPVSGLARVELESLRDGVESWQNHVREFEIVATPDYRTLIEFHAPVGYWPLDDASGTTAVAAIGTNGTYTDGPTLNQAGIVDNVIVDACPSFDGSNDHVLVLNAPLGGGNRATYSLECWVQFDTLTSTPLLIQQQNSAQTHSNAGMYVSSAGALNMDEFPPTAQNLASANGAIVTGTIYHLVAVKAPGIRELWANGVMVANDTSPETFTGSGIDRLKLAGGFGAGNRLDGKLAHVAVYNYRLTATQIGDHYALGSGS